MKNLKFSIFNFQSSRGITLVELVVAIAVFTVIAVVLGNFSNSIFNFNRYAETNLSAQSDGRRVLKTIVRELRSASPSSLGAYPLAQVETHAITFFSDIDNDGYKEKIRYFLQGVELRKGVIKPSGNPLVYESANEEISVLVHDVVNGANPIFEYFDQNYTGATPPLIHPVQATSVRLIRITLLLDKDQNKYPGPVSVESQVTLRNLKDNL